MKVYVVEFTDFTISEESGILGIYDNFESAQKRADDFSEHFIKYDAKGPLGKTEVFAYEVNQAVPGCAGEAYTLGEVQNFFPLALRSTKEEE